MHQSVIVNSDTNADDLMGGQDLKGLAASTVSQASGGGIGVKKDLEDIKKETLKDVKDFAKGNITSTLDVVEQAKKDPA